MLCWTHVSWWFVGLNELTDAREIVYVAWDVDRYADMVKHSHVQPNGVESTQHDKLQKYFSMTTLGKISEPATIVDCNGKIMVWYLPDILLPRRIVSLLEFHIKIFGLINCQELYQHGYQGTSGFTPSINSGYAGRQQTLLAFRQLPYAGGRGIWGRTTHYISRLFHATPWGYCPRELYWFYSSEVIHLSRDFKIHWWRPHPILTSKSNIG